MENKKTLCVFDFDATMYDTPMPTDENRELLSIYRNYTKSGWWGRSESLDIELFDINPNPWVLEKYNSHKSNGDTLVLMTGRIFKIKDSVMNIIEQDNLLFDEYHFADGRKTLDFKIDRLSEMVKKYNPNEVFLYDDRTEHIPTFRMFGDKYEDEYKIKFRLFHVIGHNGYELKYGKKLR